MMTATFFFLTPMIYLSGFIFPIENMPAVIQPFTLPDPAALLPRHRPRDLPEGRRLDVLWPQILALLAWGLAISAWRCADRERPPHRPGHLFWLHWQVVRHAERRRAGGDPATRSAMVNLAAALCLAVLATQNPPASAPASDPAELVKQARKLVADGRVDEALPLYRRALESDPNGFDVNLGLGNALDLAGQGTEARTHFTKAIAAATDDTRAQALTAMAISFAFEGNAREAATVLPAGVRQADRRVEFRRSRWHGQRARTRLSRDWRSRQREALVSDRRRSRETAAGGRRRPASALGIPLDARAGPDGRESRGSR